MYEGKSPADIVNRSLDALGRSDLAIGDIEEGTEGAKPALRAYGPAMRQLLRSAHWTFARKQSPMSLLADATGQTENVGTLVPAPWTYEYALPIDCVKARFLPWNSNPVQQNPPIMTGLAQPPLEAIRLRPAPFLQTSDTNYPIVTGGVPASWDQYPEWWTAEGSGPTSRSVILTNVPPQPQGAQNPTIFPSLVYTALIVFPSEWDDLFEEGMVAYLAQKLALSLAPEKIKLQVQKDQILIAKDAIREARAASANESGYPQSTDSVPDWIRARNVGGGRNFGWGGGPFGNYGGGGGLFCGWDAISMSDGSVF